MLSKNTRRNDSLWMEMDWTQSDEEISKATNLSSSTISHYRNLYAKGARKTNRLDSESPLDIRKIESTKSHVALAKETRYSSGSLAKLKNTLPNGDRKKAQENPILKMHPNEKSYIDCDAVNWDQPTQALSKELGISPKRAKRIRRNHLKLDIPYSDRLLNKFIRVWIDSSLTKKESAQLLEIENSDFQSILDRELRPCDELLCIYIQIFKLAPASSASK